MMDCFFSFRLFWLICMWNINQEYNCIKEEVMYEVMVNKVDLIGLID